MCTESFGSVRELVTHRQLHPQFKSHVCSKCALEFETVVELRNHRAKLCTKSKKAKKKVEENSVKNISPANGKCYQTSKHNLIYGTKNIK